MKESPKVVFVSWTINCLSTFKVTYSLGKNYVSL